MGVGVHITALFAALLLATQTHTQKTQVSEGGFRCWLKGNCDEKPEYVEKLSLKVSDSGSTWVYLSWDEGINDVKCDNDKPFFPISNSTIHCTNDTSDEPQEYYSSNVTIAKIPDLKASVTYKCWVEAQSEENPSCRQRSPMLSFEPGDLVELTLELTDIGSGWVHLSWDEGHEECGDEPFFPLASSTLYCNYTKDDDEPGEFSEEFSDQDTSARILDLSTNVTYTCWVEAESEASPSCRQHSPQVTFTLGDGNVTGVPDNNVIIAKFTNEIESVTTLNCTVMYEDIRTDTVWTINKRDGNTIVHKDIQSLKGFNISGVEHETSEDLCENLLNISRDTLKHLDGTTVHCGSHMNHYQAKFDIHICDMPPKLVEEVVTVWEGTTHCNITITHSKLKADNIRWSHNESNIAKDSFDMITFDEIRKGDAGTYLDEFDLICLEGNNSRPFNFSFTMDVLHGPTMEEDQKKKYLVYVGDTVTLICGTGLIGNPKPTVAWTNPQGRSVQGNEGRYVLSTKPDVTLTINGITENDGAIWKCTVEVNSNDLSVACPDPNAPNRTLEIKVVVIVRPSEPNQIKVVPVNETDVLVSWDRPTQPGSPVLTGYKLCFNGTCDMNVKGESADVGVPHLEENKCYDVTVHAVSESEGEPVEGPHSDHVWVVTDQPQNLTTSDIGYDWVYLTWNSFTFSCGVSKWEYNITCSNKSDSLTITTTDTVLNITNLLSNVTYDCTVVAFWQDEASSLSHPLVSFTPGNGTVIGVPEKVIIANFTDEVNDTVLNCTVQQGDIETDTVWEIIAGQVDAANFRIFGDGRLENSNSDSIYGNKMSISAESVKKLDGVIVYCGSHTHPRQAKFEFHIKDLPQQNVHSVVLWEGTVGCTIDKIIHSYVEAHNVVWKKDGGELREAITNNGFRAITFDTVKRTDAGLMVVMFEAKSHESARPRQFGFDLTVKVNYGPDITEGPGEHLVRGGGTIELICCENLDSNLEATVTWVSPQGKEIKASDEHYIMSKLPRVTLTINVTKSDHNGEWKCIVEVDGGDTYCPDPNKPQRTPNIHVHSIVVVPPSEPRDVHVTEATTSTIHVSWTEPSYGGNPYLDSYILCLNSDCQATDSSTKNLVVNLNQGQIHVINMYAISKSGDVTAQSDSSNAVCFANDSPHSLAFVNSGSSWAFVKWEEPSVSCQDSKYKITCNGTSHVTTTTSHNVTKLYSSTKYTCTVVAVCENSICSQKSAELTFHTREDELRIWYRRVLTYLLVVVLGGVPVVYFACVGRAPKIGKPGKPKASKIVHDSVELTWTPPSTNASKVTSYAVLFRSNEDPRGQWNRQDTNKTATKVEGLSPNVEYIFKVCALRKKYMGPESEISDPITLSF